MLLAVFRIGVAIFGLLLILIGIPLTPSPIPFGLLFIALGLALVIWAAPTAVRALRRRWRWFDRQMDRLADVLPAPLSRLIQKSDPDDDDPEKDADEPRMDDEAMAAEGRRRRALR